MSFSHLAPYDNWPVSDQALYLQQRLSDAMRRLEKDDGPAGGSELFEPIVAVFRPSRREAKERERGAREARSCQSGERGAGPWNGLHTDARVDRGPDQPLARIRNSRCACVRYQG